MTVLNLTAELERVVVDVVRLMEEFGHVEPERVLICVATTRGSGVHGTYAKIHPLRFAGGNRSARIRRGRRIATCTMPVITHRGSEVLYLIYFLLPRFFNLSLHEKLVTIFHELFHISPQFDGDIRRFPGKNYAHGSSTKTYNAAMEKLVSTYLAHPDRQELPPVLEQNMGELRERHRVVVARRMKAPKMEITRG